MSQQKRPLPLPNGKSKGRSSRGTTFDSAIWAVSLPGNLCPLNAGNTGKTTKGKLIPPLALPAQKLPSAPSSGAAFQPSDCPLCRFPVRTPLFHSHFLFICCLHLSINRFHCFVKQIFTPSCGTRSSTVQRSGPRPPSGKAYPASSESAARAPPPPVPHRFWPGAVLPPRRL